MNRNEKGFTLLEILVALVILSLGFLTQVQLFSGGLRLAAQSDQYLKGMVLAQNQFQRLEAVGFETETLKGEFAGEAGYSLPLAMAEIARIPSPKPSSGNARAPRVIAWCQKSSRFARCGGRCVPRAGDVKSARPNSSGSARCL